MVNLYTDWLHTRVSLHTTYIYIHLHVWHRVQHPSPGASQTDTWTSVQTAVSQLLPLPGRRYGTTQLLPELTTVLRHCNNYTHDFHCHYIHFPSHYLTG